MTDVATDTERFAFGENWARFLDVLDDERIAEAERSLREALGSIEGHSFLDLGCGSGLFSLAAMRLGAARVHSTDYDPASVACAAELRRRYFPSATNWTVAHGDALDRAGMAALGTFDVVYSWGVLHHTGDMDRALGHAAAAVAPGGRLFISIYNDQGPRSRFWTLVKRTYNRLPAPLRTPFAVAVMAPREALSALRWIVALRPMNYVRSWTRYKSTRGMSRWHDLIDWVGGYPFEVARPEEIFERTRRDGFVLEKLRTCGGGLGCNEFVFVREGEPG
jgi:2-polyprenyl-3-methyl-5-hydroxy-6-metoxy-1,4-benzoquinol methylase